MPAENEVTYPVGTPVGDIVNFDRSTKVSFGCPVHADSPTWRSKEPSRSNWFPSHDDSDCDCDTNTYVTREPYTS